MEKKFPPSKSKLQELTRKGDTPRSQIFEKTILFVSVIGVLWIILLATRSQFLSMARGDYSVASLLVIFVLVGMVPLLTGAFIGLLSKWYQAGFLLVKERSIVGIDKLNAVSNCKKHVDTIKRLPLDAVMMILLLGISAKGVGDVSLNILYFPPSSRQELSAMLWDAVNSIVVRSLVLVFMVGLIDYIFERWKYYHKHRMSLQDLKEEHKKEEGDPHVKSQRKSEYMVMLNSQMVQRIKQSKLIIIDNRE